MIVKIQVSTFDSEGRSRVLIYDRHRRHTYEGPSTPELLELMAGRPKAFFTAEIDNQKQIAIGDEALWQDW